MLTGALGRQLSNNTTLKPMQTQQMLNQDLEVTLCGNINIIDGGQDVLSEESDDSL